VTGAQSPVIRSASCHKWPQIAVLGGARGKKSRTVTRLQQRAQIARRTGNFLFAILSGPMPLG
jgi:hypothetical protein